MKKLFLTIIIACLGLTLFAGDCYFPVSITIKGGVENQEFKPVENMVRRAFSTENLAAEEGAMFEVVITPEEVDAETITGMRPTVAVIYDLSMTMTNVVTKEQFAATSLRVQGSGKDVASAKKAAARSLKADNVDLRMFIKKSRENVVAYYDKNLEVVLNQVRQAMEVRQLEKSMWYLTAIPACINRYDEVIALSGEIFERYLTLDCQQKITNAQLAWAASPDQDGALLAISYLSGIDRESSCNSEAQALLLEIKEAISKLYADNKEKADALFNLEMELQRSNDDNEKARIEAMRAIGVAYGKNQVENQTIINNN